jgi:TonB family protein
MDPGRAVVRNWKVTDRAHQLPADAPVSDARRAPAAPVMVDVVVLSGDVPLYEAIRNAVGERNPVWRARSAEESVDLLLTGRCGVLLIDMAAVSTRPATLVEQIVDQFPDVVVVVAGRREDESLLAGLISDGLVYRFMHKPLSPKRAGMFLNAAMRSHVERREGRGGERLMPLARDLHSRTDPRKWLFVGGGVAVFLVLLAAALVAQFGRPQEAGGASGVAPAAAVHSAGPLADPVLSRARAALAAGRFEAPAGRNALDLYSAVLLTRPDDVEARAGLATTIARLLEDAERAAAEGDFAEARRIAGRVLKVDADNAGARSVIASLAPRPRPDVAPPAASGSPPALVLSSVPPAVAPARQQTPQAAIAIAKTPVTGSLPAPVAPTSSRAGAEPPVVRPDPLAPLIVGGGTLPTSPSGPKPRAAARKFNVTAVPSLPIAGYVQRPAEVTPTAAPSTMATTDGAARVQQRDLEPVATPEPTYPPDAFRNGTEGWVEVEFTVTERGVTRDVQVVAAAPRGVFDAAAVEAVAAWRFRPRVLYGRPVPQRTSATLRFSVED